MAPPPTGETTTPTGNTFTQAPFPQGTVPTGLVEASRMAYLLSEDSEWQPRDMPEGGTLQSPPACLSRDVKIDTVSDILHTISEETGIGERADAHPRPWFERLPTVA